jgi:hypothetical protein
VALGSGCTQPTPRPSHFRCSQPNTLWPTGAGPSIACAGFRIHSTIYASSAPFRCWTARVILGTGAQHLPQARVAVLRNPHPGGTCSPKQHDCRACTLPSNHITLEAPRSQPPKGVGFPDPLSGTLNYQSYAMSASLGRLIWLGSARTLCNTPESIHRRQQT